jgi:hypothetical protein
MVVEAERTTHSSVREALRQIEACCHVNLIYNKTQPFTSSDQYAYYD